MDHTRIEPRTSTAPHGPIRRLSTAGLATVVAGAFLLFSIVGSGRATSTDEVVRAPGSHDP
jgi:hypothetical protein